MASLSAIAQTSTQMGVNYNGLFKSFDITDAATSRTTWIRGFFDVTALLQQDGTCATSTVHSDPNLTEINAIHTQYPQYLIALTLKYDFSEWGGGTPPTGTGAKYTTLQSCTNAVLDYVYPSLSLLVSGNEPFITNPPTMETVTTFYENITNNDIGYNTANATKSVTGSAIPLYVGAFNNLEKASFQTTPVKELMQYAATTPGVTGIDLHLHVVSYDGNNGAEGTDPTGGLVAAVQYAQSIFGTSKPMMSSEFSLVNYFENYLGNDLSASFLADYPDPGQYYEDVTGKRSVLGFINYTISSGGVPSAEWNDFLKTGDSEHPTWFTDRALSQNGIKNFLALSENFFSSNHFSVATYAMAQHNKSMLTSGNSAQPYAIQPWLLNALFCDSTCTPNSSGNDAQNLDWIGDFWAQQPVVPGSVQLDTKSTLLLSGDGSYQALVSVTNNGTGTAQDVQITGATLGSAAGTALPVAVGNVQPGASAVVPVAFPADAGSPGTLTAERFTGTYTGGTWGASFRATFPSSN
jgi:hypothetical protein